MLVIDLDGTTLTADRRLTDADIRAAKRLTDADIPVTIATGRLYTGTDWVARALGLQGTVAVMNGSEIVDLSTERATHAAYFTALARGRAREILEGFELATFLFRSRRILYGQRHDRYRGYLTVWTERLDGHHALFHPETWDDAEDLLAIGLLGEPSEVFGAREELLRQIPEADAVAFPTPSGEMFLKLRFGGEDKGTALARLAADRGLTVDEVVAVGDWMNDIPMLEAAGLSFAMAHAKPEVIAAADEVLSASREGGALAEIAARVWGL